MLDSFTEYNVWGLRQEAQEDPNLTDAQRERLRTATDDELVTALHSQWEAARALYNEANAVWQHAAKQELFKNL